MTAALYAVVDCAADPRLHAEVLNHGHVSALFAGKLDPDLAKAAPHLVQLHQGSSINALLSSKQGRNGAFGCVLRSDCGMGPLWRRLRKHMLARLPRGEVVMFRFFDPRVLAPYFDSLSGEEIMPWFEGITDWWLPLPTETLHYTIRDQKILRHVVPID